MVTRPWGCVMADDDKVGYGRPPKAHQFKPGQSGNPKGRPKGTKDLKTDLAEELAERIVVIEGGSQKTLSKQRAVLKALVAKAINGTPQAITALIKLIDRENNALLAAKGSALAANDVFEVATSGAAVTYIGNTGDAVAANDVFIVTNVTGGSEAVAYLGNGSVSIASIKLARQ